MPDTNDSTITKGLFITGTDTGVGKTYVTALIARQLRRGGTSVGAYKPACSGADRDAQGRLIWQDVEALSQAIGGVDPERISPQRFAAPLAPPVAARLEGKSVDSRLLRTGAQWWLGKVDVLLVEGVGGLLCPLTDDETVADLAVDLGYPLVIVARLGLGTINHTLLTLEAARDRQLEIAGIVLNEGELPISVDESCTNPAELAARCDCPVLGIVHQNSTELMRNGAQVEVDWMALAKIQRAETTGCAE